MEKGFKGASELTNEVTLAEADVLRFVKNPFHFIGKELSIDPTKNRWVCAYLEIDADGTHDGHGAEPVLLNGTVIGSTSSVAYGHSVGKILAFAYIRPEAHVGGQAISVVIAGTERKGRVLNAAAYDPLNLRPRSDDLGETEK